MNQNTLQIGALAKKCGVSTDTLRYYEKHGLLTPAMRSEAGYRLYSAGDIARIEFIVSAKDVGFTLREISELLELEVTRDQRTCEQVKAVVDDKIEVVQQKVLELTRIQRSLSTLSAACCGGSEPATHCTILETLADRQVRA